jgi:hypothetical protein
MVVILVKAWSTGIETRVARWTGALMGLLAAAGLLNTGAFAGSDTDKNGRSSWTAPLRHHLALLAWLLLPLLAVWLISLRQPLFTDRYLIWTAPAFYLLVAVTLTTFASAKDWTRWVVLLVVGIILAVNGFNLWHQGTRSIKSDFRAAAAYVASYNVSMEDNHRSLPAETGSRYTTYLPFTVASEAAFEDLVIFQIPHGRYTFDYYFSIEGYPYVSGLFTNHRTANGGYVMSEAQAAEQMEAVTSGYAAVWLIATEVPMWDERNLVQHWLERHGERVAERNLRRVDVYRYELTSTRKDEGTQP